MLAARFLSTEWKGSGTCNLIKAAGHPAGKDRGVGVELPR